MSIGGAGIGSGGVLEQQQSPASRVLAAWLTSAMRVCTSKPALQFTRLREASTAASAGLKIQTSSDRNTGKGTRTDSLTPLPPRAPCPSHGANAARSMQTGARRIVQGSEVLISHLHKSKRVSKLGTRGAKQHAMRRKRGTVLLFRDEIDRSDSVFGNATPRAVRKVPARRSRATSHARVAEISAVGVGREKKANLLRKKFVALRAPSQKNLWWQDS